MSNLDKRLKTATTPSQSLTHRVRKVDPRLEHALIQQGLHPLMARLLAARGVRPVEAVEVELKHLLPPEGLKGIQEAADILADAIEAGARMVVVGDYDCDGATATAVGVRGLRMILSAMGADAQACAWHVDFLVPNRFEYGYGLSPAIVDLAAERFEPDLLITVDNGIASVEGVDRAEQMGMSVIVTDHHLPGAQLPAAAAIVNPNQPGCGFASKSIAGVGVMFYVLLQLRKVLRERGAFDASQQPRLDSLLDLVALGTVADVVKLDPNNRRLVQHGLERIRAGRAQPGVLALFQQAGRDHRTATASDIGFALAPRLNAAGRLADMALGIRCLLTDNAQEALTLADELGQMNNQRRQIESEMKVQAEADLEPYLTGQDRPAVVVSNPDWHHGVIGILASRIKDRLYRPVMVLAPSDDGDWRGSGRSIPGVHLRDVLDLVCKRLPAGAMPKFGGHAMAAGLTLKDGLLAAFTQEFERAVGEMADAEVLTRNLESDGSLPADWMSVQTVDLLRTQVWGQGFPPPLFVDEFEVLGQRILKEAHSKFSLRRDGAVYTALRWGCTEQLPGKAKLAYRMERDHFRGGDTLQLVIEQVL